MILALGRQRQTYPWDPFALLESSRPVGALTNTQPQQTNKNKCLEDPEAWNLKLSSGLQKHVNIHARMHRSIQSTEEGKSLKNIFCTLLHLTTVLRTSKAMT